jgi:hypothetical protein
MNCINTPVQALECGGVASSWAPRGGVSHLAFPALAREWNHHTASIPLASLGNQTNYYLFSLKFYKFYFVDFGAKHGISLPKEFMPCVRIKH